MKLKKLVSLIECTLKNGRDVSITGISEHSKLLAPGNLFIAAGDGINYIPDAIDAGASAIITDLFNPFVKIPQIIHPNPHEVAHKILAAFYPIDKLKLIGITGTNGKTTTAYLTSHLLGNCGMIGTIEYIVGEKRRPARLTTPDLATTYKLLHEMQLSGQTHAVMEVSSHGLDQGRVNGLNFDLGIFTNLSQDHLDYHKDMDAYLEAKKKLFPMCKTALLNADCPINVPGQTYSIDNPADFQATNIHLTTEGSSFRLNGIDYTSPLLGRFNIYNVIAALIATDFPDPSKLQNFPGVPGRMETVRTDPTVIVDFAHTEKALENALQTLKELKPNHLITVFGCGGNRDALKRPLMAKVAEKYSTHTIVTSDNPRHESPMQIINEILVGFKSPSKYSVEADRRLAIKQAIEMAKPGDIVLIAGRGHEPSQLIDGRAIPFDDRQVAKEV
ncbi:MAG: UDP-N-acetylmuramoyl-L-alanyl-D-glutamate--2,6-diaminopimelate ligase [Chlamydiia bacterium]|nr:UDP-N-acetylmuramoyl-L-alanyl-D-glutamate--2,6-diaminopimelate ligase [Chlamydiia bacterium]MCH9615036.1 UDP-N-acetylmuramoyl-L-alanyl-D-glutamate--2,6-diaminopimelate ligase [Chlamydiia bacterium]MCH9629913.1 UDP-N-acetylmuramoyl-L-alanyl-D-glutamate--2,6-diaminopimelate ligase [Chlamydiia bacterium]